MTGVTIEDINTRVYTNGETSDARFMIMKMRMPYDDGTGTDIIDSFTLDTATVANYRSGGRLFTITYDSGGT